MNILSVHKNRLCKIKTDYLSSTMQDVEQCSLKTPLVINLVVDNKAHLLFSSYRTGLSIMPD